MNIVQLGNKITDYRKSNHMTIKEFSVLSGVSSALLSQLERGLGNPSLSVLDAIARTMEMSISTLLEESIKLESLVKRNDSHNVIMNSNDNCVEVRLLTTKSSKLNDNILRAKVEPNCSSKSYEFSIGDFDEIILIESGTVEISSDDGDFVTLNKDDTMRLIANSQYKLKNISNTEAIILYIVSNSKEINVI